MKGITLRRTKDDKIDGIPLLSLPQKYTHVIMLDFSPSERLLYDKIHAKGKIVFEALKSQAGGSFKNYVNILRAILLMRQACLHPNLLKFDVDDNMNADQLNHKPTFNEAKSILNLLRLTEDDNCIFCNSSLDSMNVFVTRCKHTYIFF